MESSTYPPVQPAYVGGFHAALDDEGMALHGKSVDQVRIYDRALSAAEITALANPSYP